MGHPSRIAALVSIFMMLLITAGRYGLAQPVDQDEARAVAAAWLAALERPQAGQSSPRQIGRMEALVVGGERLGYIAHLEPTGYIVVSPRRELPPVKAYSLSHGFVSRDGEGLADVLVLELSSALDTLARPIAQPDPLADNQDEPGAGNRVAWERLLDPEAAAASSKANPTVSVGPLLTSAWGQREPYNLLCPISCGRAAPAGCVTIAVAQVMYYWQHPAHGYGSHSYAWDGGGCEPAVLSASFDDSFEWRLMTDHGSTAQPRQAQLAVAELCYEIGVAFNSEYTISNTGALVGDAVTVLPTYFGYNLGIDRENRLDYDSDEAWFDVFRAELDESRPVLLALRGTHDSYPGAIRRHAVVVDGYQSRIGLELLHINMGWTAWYDDWYALNGIHTGASHWNLEEEQHLVRGIMPDRCEDPAAPAGLEVGESTEGEPVLTWRAVDLVERYEVQQAATAAFASPTTQVAITPELLIEPAAPGGVAEDRYYRVRAIDLCGAVPLGSPWSGAVHVHIEPGDPGPEPIYRSLVAGIAHTTGSGSTAWRSDLAACNLSDQLASLELVLRLSSSAGTQPLVATASLAPGAAAEWRDVLSSLFGLEAEAAGAVEVRSNVPVLVSARTYTTGTYTTGTGGTYGQRLPGCALDDALVPGGTAVLTQLRHTAEYRTNIGFVNLGSSEATAWVQLYDATGTAIGIHQRVDVEPDAWVQVSDMLARAGADDCPLAYATVEVTGQDAAIWAYASVIDRRTGDPLTVPMIRR